jgi:hypothetical protein
MGRTVIKDFGDLRRKDFDFQISCRRCQRNVIIDGRTLDLWREVFRWGHCFDDVANRFPCRNCGPGTIEWGFIRSSHGHATLDLFAVARNRRDACLIKARLWHELSRGRDPRMRRRRR